MKRVQHGFTLVEILVTITIISIMSAVGLVTYQDIVKKGRDAQRQSDLRLIQSALEQFQADNHFYPDGTTVQIQFGNIFTYNSKTYMKQIPSDPRHASISTYPEYKYEALSCSTDNPPRCTDYCIHAALEVTAVSSPPVGCSKSYPTTPVNYQTDELVVSSP